MHAHCLVRSYPVRLNSWLQTFSSSFRLSISTAAKHLYFHVHTGRVRKATVSCLSVSLSGRFFLQYCYSGFQAAVHPSVPVHKRLDALYCYGQTGQNVLEAENSLRYQYLENQVTENHAHTPIVNAKRNAIFITFLANVLLSGRRCRLIIGKIAFNIHRGPWRYLWKFFHRLIL